MREYRKARGAHEIKQLVNLFEYHASDATLVEYDRLYPQYVADNLIRDLRDLGDLGDEHHVDCDNVSMVPTRRDNIVYRYSFYECLHKNRIRIEEFNDNYFFQFDAVLRVQQKCVQHSVKIRKAICPAY